MIESRLWGAIPASLAACLLLAGTTTAFAQQQNQSYYPYGYYQGGQPGNYQWAPRDTAAQPKTAPQPAAPASSQPPANSAGTAAPQANTPQQPSPTIAPPSQAAPMAGGGMPAGMQAVSSRLGQVLADAQGRTLYIFDKETAGVPLCEGECARLWPPLLSDGKSAMAAPFFLVPREDGSRQWAWNGRPLYRWIGDTEAGDVTGDGMNGVWHALRMR